MNKGYSLNLKRGKITIRKSRGYRTFVSSNTVEIKRGGKVLFSGRLVRAKDRVVLEGKINLGEGIAGIAKPGLSGLDKSSPYPEIFTLTSGQPKTTQFDSLYFLQDDLLLEIEAEERSFSPAPKNCRIRISDPKEIILTFHESYYRTNFNHFFKPTAKLPPTYTSPTRGEDWGGGGINSYKFKKRFPYPPVGWLSWYCYFGEFNEKEALKTADFASRYLKDFGLEYIQLENWQKKSDKTPVYNFYHSLESDPERFPHGMKYLADRIHKKGLKAGLWVVPLATGEDEFFNKNHELFLTDCQGKPILSWAGKYTYDPTHPKAQKFIYRMLHTITQDWGYEYVKIDGLECGGDPVNGCYMDTVYYQKPVQKLFYDKKEKDPLRRIALLIREAIGPRIFFTVCGGKIKKNGKFVGVGDAARIGGDVFWEGENPQWKAVVHTAGVTTKAYHVHNIFWYNDPDVLSLRPPLTRNHAEVLATIHGLAGQSLFSSDILYQLPKNRLDILKRLMPVPNIYPTRFYQTEEIKDIWNLIIKKDFEQWNVVGLFNWDKKEEKKFCLEMKSLGLSEEKEYLLYEFWKDEFLGSVKEAREFLLPPQSCLLLAIREKKPHPQILSVNRHLTQDAVSLKTVSWIDETNSLAGRSMVPGGFEYTLTIHLPAGYQIKSVDTDKGKVWFQKVSSEISKVFITSPKKTIVRWGIGFVGVGDKR